jgi:ElaB/YqjD/DUF883 family membrane-anchored ribosome-binding protein
MQGKERARYTQAGRTQAGNTQAGFTQVSAAAERIVRNGSDVRSRIAGLAVNTFRVRRSEIEQLASLVEEVLLGVVGGLQGLGREQRDVILREVFEGLADAYGQIGRENRRQDQWERFEARITEAVTTIASRAGEDIMSEFKNVRDQVREAGERFKPRAKAAMHAIEENVIEPASEAATQGAKSARRTIGVLLAAAGEMLRDFGDSIREEPKAGSTPRSKSASKSGATRKTPSAPRPTPAAPSKNPGTAKPASPASASKKATGTASKSPHAKASATSTRPKASTPGPKQTTAKPTASPAAKSTPATKRPAAKPPR